MADISPKYGKTFAYHLTLQAAADLFNVEFNVISSLGPAATTVISPQNSVPISSFYIGHFAEGDSEHYVALQNDAMWQERMEERAAESDEVPESTTMRTKRKAHCQVSLLPKRATYKKLLMNILVR